MGGEKNELGSEREEEKRKMRRMNSIRIFFNYRSGLTLEG
jgi:hypothetical protein